MVGKTQDLIELMADLEEEKLLKEISDRLEEKVDPGIILEQCREGIRLVGERFEKGEYFISQLIMAGEVFGSVMKVLTPLLTSNNKKSEGKVVFGTVKSDIHDLGKDIVIAMLRADGFEVFDLGVDVPAEAFVNKLKETGARVLGLSGLIPISYDNMKETVQALTRAGLREKVKVMIGGGLTDEMVRSYTGADAWGSNAIDAVTLCHKLMEGK